MLISEFLKTTAPGTPSRSRVASRSTSRASSPTRTGANKRRVPGPLHLPKGTSSDPLRVFPTEVSQRLFALLDARDLARCSRVCKKWEKSQTLNHVWFQHHRRESFHDEDLPPGKWTRRESKQNWRLTFMKEGLQRSREQGLVLGQTVFVPPARTSRPNSPYFSGGSNPSSGYATPREAREEQWRLEAEGTLKPSKIEMREMYKELGGRKSRGKGKFGPSAGIRNKGTFGDDANEAW